jgi:hypothetical protein
MPFLNWTEASIHQTVSSHPQLGTQLTLGLKSTELQMLISLLEDVYSHQGHELRLALPQGWVLFWKRKDAESRILLAHPEEKEWVATVALESASGQKWVEALKGLHPGQPGFLSQLAPLSGMSNLEIMIFLEI